MAPGVAVHELGHVLLCRLSGVPIRRVVLFQVGNPAGYVSHAAPRLLRQHLAISSGPLLVSSILATALFAVALRAAQERAWLGWPAVAALALWLGASVALEAWPSTGDAQALGRSAALQLRRLNPGALLALALTWALLAANASRRVGGHWVYAGLLAAAAWRIAVR